MQCDVDNLNLDCYASMSKEYVQQWHSSSNISITSDNQQSTLVSSYNGDYLSFKK